MANRSAIAAKINAFLVVNDFELEVKMPHEFVNVTLPTVIKDVLEDYPEHPYRVVFSTHEFRQKLVDRILSQTSNLNEGEGQSAPLYKQKSSYKSPLAERLYLEVVVRGSILHVLRENADRLSDVSKDGDYSLKPLFG
ncbi:hypothetical protein V2H45_19515 [Tumidithrix elongata RA019]|uniref:Uncharacterized protein n=1 Tax=Tumidithrix elongata BACA0141 TaxID=2716417 RepID=A0AAW9Q0Z4_9CYAN|nr:hypothetical protein [Tumidithrix elongata RA019]